MIHKKTTLILGAGASAPYQYPTGKSLKNRIIEDISEEAVIREYNFLEFTRQNVFRFRDDLLKSAQPSIDAFLEYRTEYMDIGKIAITRELIKHEEKQILYRTDDWYQYLFNKLGTDFDKFNENKISIITFNYDRSLEQFLFDAVQSKYGKTNLEVAKKINTMKIIHVHGQVGYLPWQEKEPIREYKAFGEYSDTINSSKAIKIIHEGDDGSVDEKFKEAYQEINTASKVIFLGFGYHDLNMKRLKIDTINRSKISAVGSSFGLSEAQRDEIMSKTQGKLHLHFPNARNQTALTFLEEFIKLE